MAFTFDKNAPIEGQVYSANLYELLETRNLMMSLNMDGIYKARWM